MTDTVTRSGLAIDRAFCAFVEDEAMAGTGVDASAFWAGLAKLLADFAPKYWRAARRARQAAGRSTPGTRRQGQADRPAPSTNASCARSAICVPEGAGLHHRHAATSIRNRRVAGPQLVVPVTNARYALNAANARWGSLYDALYGTDAIPEDGGATRGERLQPGARRAR